MNLTDYPTPQLDEFKSHWTISRRRTKQATFAAEAFKRLAQLEREAAALHHVIRCFQSDINTLRCLIPHKGPIIGLEGQEAFDALKSQLTKP